jgi:hypothetical protein
LGQSVCSILLGARRTSFLLLGSLPLSHTGPTDVNNVEVNVLTLDEKTAEVRFCFSFGIFLSFNHLFSLCFFEEKGIIIPKKFEDLALTAETRKGLAENKFIALRQIQVKVKTSFPSEKKTPFVCFQMNELLVLLKSLRLLRFGLKSC